MGHRTNAEVLLVTEIHNKTTTTYSEFQQGKCRVRLTEIRHNDPAAHQAALDMMVDLIVPNLPRIYAESCAKAAALAESESVSRGEMECLPKESAQKVAK